MWFPPGAGLLEPALAWAHETGSSSMSTAGDVGRNEERVVFGKVSSHDHAS